MGRPVASILPGAGCVPAEPPPAPAAEAPAVSRLLKALNETDAGRYDYLLLLRFGVLNLVGLALLTAAWMHGWVAAVLGADATNLSLAIFGVFLAGLGLCAIKVRQTSHEINLIRAIRRPQNSRVAGYLAAIEGRNADSRAIVASALRIKLFSRISMVRHMASSLVFLGLIGTVIGFIIALSGVEPNAASDPSSIAPMVATLIEGMSIALYTTLVGAILNVWLMANYHLLASGTVRLFTATVELGERYAKH